MHWITFLFFSQNYYGLGGKKCLKTTKNGVLNFINLQLKNDKTVMPAIGVFEQFFVDFTKLIILSQKSDLVGMF